MYTLFHFKYDNCIVLFQVSEFHYILWINQRQGVRSNSNFSYWSTVDILHKRLLCLKKTVKTFKALGKVKQRRRSKQCVLLNFQWQEWVHFELSDIPREIRILQGKTDEYVWAFFYESTMSLVQDTVLYNWFLRCKRMFFLHTYVNVIFISIRM